MKTAGYKSLAVKAHGALIVCIILLLSAGCGGSSDGSSSTIDGNMDSSKNDSALVGTFIDAVVEGLKYEIGSVVNYTDSDGAFQYSSGDEIQFYIGAIKLGNTAAGNTIISPLDLVENGDYDNDEAINIARFLQTLDSDKSDGSVITIPSSVHERAEEEILVFDSSSFDDDAAVVIDALTNGNGDYDFVPFLVPRAAAIAHLKESLGNDTSSEDSDDTDETADDGEDVFDFSGTWEATDSNMREDITSVGDFVISESDGSYYANGSWNIVTPVPNFGNVATHIEFSDVPVTINNGAMHFTTTVVAYTDVAMFLTSPCTLEVYDATPTSCSYRFQFDSTQWVRIWETYILGSTASDDWVYVGNALVTVSN